MTHPEIPHAALDLVERLATAIRVALGEEIDAYPGARSPEQADPINRAFAAIVRSLLGAVTGETVIAPDIVSRTLHRATVHRLAGEGWSDPIVAALIDEEPGRPDDWLIFLLLRARVPIEPLVENDHEPR